MIRSIRRKLRVATKDSAYIYAILESYEGLTSYSTLEYTPGSAYRDLELRVPIDFESEVDEILKSLGEMIYDYGEKEFRD